MLDREEDDEGPRDHERTVAPRLRDPEVGKLVRRHRGAEDPAVVGHGGAEHRDQDVDRHFEPPARPLGHQYQERLHADVPGVAHAHRPAHERHVEDQDQRQVLGQRRAGVHHVAPEHLERHDGEDHHQPAHGEVHSVAGEARVEARQHGVYWVSWMRFTRSWSFGVFANLPYTGFIASMNSCLLAMVFTCDPAASTTLRDLTSRSSQSLRMYGTDSLAALRISAWSSFERASQIVFEKASTSGASECSVRL